MRLHRKTYLLVLMSVWLPGFASEASACTCGPVEPCEAYTSASTVFVGRVLKVGMESSKVLLPSNAASTTVTRGSTVAHFLVEETFRGIDEKEADISGESTTCDYHFKEGQRYLVYAYRSPDGKRLHTNICSGTALLSAAKGHVAYLRGETRAPSGGTFYGQVYRTSYDYRNDHFGFEYLTKAKVILESGSRRFQALTGKKGKFSISGLPAGSYKVRTDPPTNSENVFSREPKQEWEVEIPDHGCAWHNFQARQNGEISGQVVDDTGRGVEDVRVEVTSAAPNVSYRNLPSETTDKEGRFKFTFLPPGPYFLGFNITEGPALYDSHTETYYPGVAERARATPIFVGENQSLGGFKLHIPPRLPERVIEGVAVWKDGRPAVDVPIVLHNPRSDYGDFNRVHTDAQGRFAIKCFEGQMYELSAMITNGTRLVNSKPLMIRVGRETTPVRLVVELP